MLCSLTAGYNAVMGTNGLNLDGTLQQQIKRLARDAGLTPQDYIRRAIDKLAADRNAKPAPAAGGGSLFDAFEEAGLIGCLAGAPADLSTNKAYFDGFGRD